MMSELLTLLTEQENGSAVLWKKHHDEQRVMGLCRWSLLCLLYALRVNLTINEERMRDVCV
jgi:hypothetical protein